MYVRTMEVGCLRVQVGRATFEACSGNLEVSGTIPTFALVPRETKKNLCRDGRSLDLPDSDLLLCFTSCLITKMTQFKILVS